jgi:hypothetical protein
MSFASKRAAAFAALCLSCACAFGQDATPAVATATTPTPPSTPLTAPCCVLADGTLVQIEVAETLNTKTVQRGQRFPLRLVEPVYAGGTLVLPVGTEGEGEVVHAEHARMAGKAGELILAARFLRTPSGDLPLRGMKLGGAGKSHADAAFWVPLVGFVINGGEVEVPAGTRAQAKLAGQATLPPVPPAPAGDAGDADRHPSASAEEGARPAPAAADAVPSP